MEKFALTKEGCLNEEEYFKWAESTTPLSLSLLHLLYQVCHVRFGLRPRTKADETMVIGGYMLRFHKTGLRPGDTVYIIDGEWFKQWRKVTGYEGDPCSNDAASSGKKKKKKKDKHRHKKHRAPSPQVILEAGKAHASTQTPPTGTGGVGMGGEAGLVERGEDVVELLTVAEGGGGGRQMTPNSSFSSLNWGDSPSQASSGVVAGREGAGPVENSIPLIDNSGLLVHDSTNKKVTSLTNEGGFLKKELVEGETFFFLPVVVWKVFTSWYGTAGLQGGPALPRLVRADGSIDFHPVQFKVYRHTTLPPAGKQSSLPWPLPSFFGTLGISSSKPATPPIVSSAGVGPGGADGGPIQPPLPRRVLYYYAAFTGATAVAEMSEYIEKVLHVKSEDLRLYDLTDE
ncbi:Ubiquitin carboxyl-terminal hydrolase 32, partial [Geodia barretti]